MSADATIELDLVGGGPGDGMRLVVPAVCPCCGEPPKEVTFREAGEVIAIYLVEGWSADGRQRAVYQGTIPA